MCGVGALVDATNSPTAFLRAVYAQLRMRFANRTFSLARRLHALRRHGFGMFFEGSLYQYFTTHEHQLAQLSRLRFDRVRAFAENGDETNVSEELNGGYSIHYLVRAAHG